jgi:gliding motility-associated-like protein
MGRRAWKYLNLILILVLTGAYEKNIGQVLSNQWDKAFGGIDRDVIQEVITTCDGGFALSGDTESPISGTITESTRGVADYWLVKLDSLGNHQWNKRFGGTLNDWRPIVIQTNDNGFLIGGSSQSGPDNDKSEPNWDSTLSTFDFWIIKLDNNGNPLWDKRYGGNRNDILEDVVQTSDGGYILAGVSDSPVSGNKSALNIGSYDYWIVKIDSLGNLMWDKSYGGNLEEYLASLYLTQDNRLIIGGTTRSGASGNISQPNRDTTNGTTDYWLITTNAIGNIIWEKRYGGSDTDFGGYTIPISSGGFAVCGYSNSPISGDKSVPRYNNSVYFSTDYWFLKLDDNGVKVFDRVFGSSDIEDGRCSITETHDNHFLITGNSLGGISDDKTEANLAYQQSWVIKVDGNGSLKWDNTIQQVNTLVSHAETGVRTVETSDGCFVTANFTDAGIGGDKTQPLIGYYDFFLLKYCDDLQPLVYIDPCRTFIGNTSLADNSPLNESNVFTPNGDGINDLFTIQAEGIENATCIVYNRWGVKVAEFKQPGQGWDGRTISGQDAVEGVYYFILSGRKDGEQYVQNGFLQLLR